MPSVYRRLQPRGNKVHSSLLGPVDKGSFERRLDQLVLSGNLGSIHYENEASSKLTVWL